MKRMIKSPVFWAVLATLLLIGPQLERYRFVGTDCTHAAFLEGIIDYHGMKPFHLYRFADGTYENHFQLTAHGPRIWFGDPLQKTVFMRHLSSAAVVLNHKICGTEPFGYGVHTMLWFMLVTVLVGLLANRVFALGKTTRRGPPLPGSGTVTVTRWAPIMAVLIFILAGRNAPIFFYGSTRWMLVAASFGLVALLAHVKWREEDWAPGRFLAVGATALAMASGEASLALLSYLVAYELFGSADPFKKRLKALIPYGVLVLVYLAIYAGLGYGAAGQDAYISPIQNPVAFLQALPAKVANMIAEMFMGTMTFWGINPLVPGKLLHTYLAAGLSLVLCGLLLYPAWKRADTFLKRRFKWLVAGAFGAMVPLSGAAPCTRVVLNISFCGTILMAFLLDFWGRRLFKKKNLKKNLKSPAAWLALLLCLGIVFVHFLYSPYYWHKYSKVWSQILEEEQGCHLNGPLSKMEVHENAVFLNGGWWYEYAHRIVNRMPMPGTWRQLSMYYGEHCYVRTAPDTLVMETVGGSLLAPNSYGGVYRSSRNPLKKGDVIELPDVRITILAVTPQGGLTHIEFKFPYSLDDPCYRFYRFGKECYHEVEIPPVGQAFKVPPAYL